MNEQNTVELGQLDGERGMPTVHDAGPSTKQRGVIVAIIVIIAGLVGGAWYWRSSMLHSQAKADQKPSSIFTNSVPQRTFSLPPEPTPKDSAPVPLAPAPLPQASAPVPPPPVAGAPVNTGPAITEPVLDKSGSGLMVTGGASTAQQPQQEPVQSQGSSRGQLAKALVPTATPGVHASVLHNRDYLLAKGSVIPCALQTKLVSTIPGMTSCVVTRNVYSDDGKVLLIDRGSTVSGEYQSNMKQGMARIFVLWSRVKTPSGVVINLDSPGTDALGAAGVPGYIDNHFWERFGGALMLSLINDFASYVGQRTNNNSGNVQFSNTEQTTQDMAAEALKNTINIPPTLYANQGAKLAIYVARDLDFSGVYHVEPTAQ